MLLHKLSNRKTGGYTTFGSVWKPGEQKDTEFILKNESGEQIPVQSRAAAWWPDGSMKWLAHTADSVKMGSSSLLLPAAESGSMGDEEGILIHETEDSFAVCTGPLTLTIPKTGDEQVEMLAKDLRLNQTAVAARIYPVFQLERRTDSGRSRTVSLHEGLISTVSLEEAGPLQAVFCFGGCHVRGEEVSIPFVIRMYLGLHSAEVRLEHTALFDGQESRDYLKGMGIRTEVLLTGKAYERHVRFAADHRVLHEAAVMLESRIPRVPQTVLRQQLVGGFTEAEADDAVTEAAGNLPVWNRYVMCQDYDSHFSIKKQTGAECCTLNCRQGKRALGAMAVSGRKEAVWFGIRDFWQKYPAGLEVNSLSRERSECTMWFYCPEAEAFDFRHYDTRSYPYTCYEGFEHVGASAVGIGVSSECSVVFAEAAPTDEGLLAYGERMQNPPVYVGTPEYYHEKHAFGHWSLPMKANETEVWLEAQMEQAFAFYQQEIEARSWYGLFDYGDVMHSYDSVRHCWKYDVGGFAWQNTELVPTYWLWLYFLRTGREDVFTMAEAMSRHCSEVDVYHFGPYQGLGSRHNVRHWGCSCKEPRIGMAGHFRFLHYLIGDRRLGDVMDDVKDADHATVNFSPAQNMQPEECKKASVRSGPDWSSFVSNWMTCYERTLDETYRRKIETGIDDIAAAPYGLASGPDYGYDVENAHLIYWGEREDTPNQHLQICMGGPQVWWETADMLGDDRLNELIARLGRFYYHSKEKKARLTAGRIVERPFSWPMFAAGIAGYSAGRTQNKELALKTWRILIGSLTDLSIDGFVPVTYGMGADDSILCEIPWISTNVTAQWCLNVIMCLEFIREYLPEYARRKKDEFF